MCFLGHSDIHILTILAVHVPFLVFGGSVDHYKELTMSLPAWLQPENDGKAALTRDSVAEVLPRMEICHSQGPLFFCPPSLPVQRQCRCKLWRSYRASIYLLILLPAHSCLAISPTRGPLKGFALKSAQHAFPSGASRVAALDLAISTLRGRLLQTSGAG